jgi:hypothetical protein
VFWRTRTRHPAHTSQYIVDLSSQDPNVSPRTRKVEFNHSSALARYVRHQIRLYSIIGYRRQCVYTESTSTHTDSYGRVTFELNASCNLRKHNTTEAEQGERHRYLAIEYEHVVRKSLPGSLYIVRLHSAIWQLERLVEHQNV